MISVNNTRKVRMNNTHSNKTVKLYDHKSYDSAYANSVVYIGYSVCILLFLFQDLRIKKKQT